MRPGILKAGLGFTLGLALSACDPTSLQQADDQTSQPATAETVIGIWRTDIPMTTTPPTDVKVTMEVDANGTMILSQRVATGQQAPYDNVEIARENWTWKVEDGNMVSVKTTCEYKDPQTMQTSGTECTAPLDKTAAINVKGNAWTVVENGQPIVFRKD